jgi:hypothetical protein
MLNIGRVDLLLTGLSWLVFEILMTGVELINYYTMLDEFSMLLTQSISWSERPQEDIIYAGNPRGCVLAMLFEF